MSTAFGDIIREWRAIRRFSQLDLSLEATTSARHVSFLESGRAQPSRSMVLKLSDALKMPKEIVNQAMNAAGFASVFPTLPADDQSLDAVHSAIKLMLSNHEPFPGVAINRHWDITNANASAISLFEKLGVAGAGNMIDALEAAGESDIIENWEETTLLAMARLRSEIFQCGGDRTLERLVSKLSRHPRLANPDAIAIDYSQAVIPSIFNLSEYRLSLFSTIAQFGTVQDVATSDVRIELMFPADEASRAYFQRTADA